MTGPVLPTARVSVCDYLGPARAALPPPVWDFIEGGSGDELTLRAELVAYDRYVLRPSVLVDVSACDTSVEVLGCTSALPVLVAPMAYQRLVHPDGELATVAAAGDVGVPVVVSALASTEIEAIADSARSPLWMQLYCFRDRTVTATLAKRAEEAGYRALMLTVDAPRLGRRRRDLRNGFHLPPDIQPVNLPAVAREGLHDASPASSVVATHAAALHDATLSWDDIEWLRSLTSLPVLLKGILRADDARRAVDAGVDGIVVSTHGGRQLDGVPAALDVLPEVVAGVRGECSVLVDGGVRRGTDVVKAIALGADAVLLGRPVLWGLAAAGADGVRDVLELLRAETEDALALLGRQTPRDLDASVLRRLGCGCAGCGSA